MDGFLGRHFPVAVFPTTESAAAHAKALPGLSGVETVTLSVSPKGHLFPSHSAHMVSLYKEKSIPYESHGRKPVAHNLGVAKKSTWREWGGRFRELAQLKHTSTRKLAEKLELHESTVRSWLNGNREINLTDFFLLCQAASLDPGQVLFGSTDHNFIAISRAWEHADEQGKRLLSIAADAVLKEDESKQRGSTSVER